MYSCVNNLPLSTFWVFDFEIFAPVWYFLFYYEHEGISHVHTLYNLLCFTHIVLYSVSNRKKDNDHATIVDKMKTMQHRKGYNYVVQYNIGIIMSYNATSKWV